MHTIILLALSFSVVLAGTSYSLVDNFSGSTFFSNFQYFTGPDPTHGYVYYASASESQSWGYTYVTTADQVVHIRSDDTSVSSGSGRGSVRLTSNKSYNSGLFVFDVKHMPFGCGTWPAIWLVGPDWPNNGEIDVIEGVNNINYNSMTLHTKAGCTIPANPLETGYQASTNCDVAANGNQGCSVHDLHTNSYGAGFNSNGGGVHTMLWNSSFIKIWFFPRNSIPADITSGNPNPDSWGTPAANFPFGSNCPSTYFKNQQIVIDNTFCGDWAGNADVYGNSGCPSTCVNYVQNNPSAFSQAYWEINSFKVYQPSAGTTAAATTKVATATVATATTKAPTTAAAATTKVATTAATATTKAASTTGGTGQSTSGCGTGLLYCPGNSQCYSSSQYVCSTTYPYLCPTAAPHFCAGGCSSTAC